jgi:hypothetical protein
LLFGHLTPEKPRKEKWIWYSNIKSTLPPPIKWKGEEKSNTRIEFSQESTSPHDCSRNETSKELEESLTESYSTSINLSMNARIITMNPRRFASKKPPTEAVVKAKTTNNHHPKSAKIIKTIVFY